jgi:hypothetical protein
MGSEIKGGVLNIQYTSIIKTDFDICHNSLVEKNTSDHCKKNNLVISNELLTWL